MILNGPSTSKKLLVQKRIVKACMRFLQLNLSSPTINLRTPDASEIILGRQHDTDTMDCSNESCVNKDGSWGSWNTA